MSDVEASESVPAQPLPLEYADACTHYGIQVETTEHDLRIVVPRPDAEHWFWSVLTLPAVLLFRLGRLPHAIILDKLKDWYFWGEIRAIPRATKPVVIELDQVNLVFRNLHPKQRDPDVVMPRRAIRDVEYDAHWDNVVVRWGEWDSLSLHLIDDPRVQRWLAETLSIRLRKN